MDQNSIFDDMAEICRDTAEIIALSGTTKATQGKRLDTLDVPAFVRNRLSEEETEKVRQMMEHRRDEKASESNTGDRHTTKVIDASADG